MSRELPAETGRAEVARLERLSKRAKGIEMGTPGRGDPAGTVARFAWPFRSGGACWAACGHLVRKDGLLEVGSLRLEPLPVGWDDDQAPVGSGAVVTSDVLRAVSLTAITAAAQAHLAVNAAAEAELAALTGCEPRPESARNAAARPSGAGRPPLSDSLLRETAEAWLAEAPAGAGIYGRMADGLKERLGRPFTGSQVRTAIGRAEDDGWLTRGKAGSIQRGAGPRLLAAWREERQAAAGQVDGGLPERPMTTPAAIAASPASPSTALPAGVSKNTGSAARV
jgi:hypothetical protein